MRRNSFVNTSPKFAMSAPWQRFGILLGTIGFIVVCFRVATKSSEDGDKSKHGDPDISYSSMISVPIEEVMAGDPIVLAQDDPRVTQYIWNHGYIVAPSEIDYNLTAPNKNPSMGQGQMIRKIFKDMVSQCADHCVLKFCPQL